MKKFYLIVLASFAITFTGCSRDMSDLTTYIKKVKARKASSIEEIPPIKEHPKHTYQSSLLRSPFARDTKAEAEERDNSIKGGVERDENRNKEFLEAFPLDSLQMVGTLNSKGINYALVKTADGLLHQVKPGNFMGENDGQVMNVTESGIEIREIVPDGLGNLIYRPSEIPLEENI